VPKLLLVQPTQYDAAGKLCKQKKIYLPGLQFPLLAAMTPPQWEIEAKIEVVDDIDFESDADLVGIGGMGHAAFRGLEIAREFKRRGKTVVMGGYMASMAVDEALKTVDSVVVGDAEISYPLMLDDFEKKGRPERAYRHPISTLDGLPLPRYEILTEKPIGDMLPVQAGRGCPNICGFCSIACLYEGKYLFRPVEQVLRDIARVKELGFKSFYLIDDNILGNPAYFLELCAAIKPLKMTWASQCSLALGDRPELLKAARESGVSMLSFGVESITQEGLDRLGKSWLRVADHERRIKAISESGIMVSSEMIAGTDSDTEESLSATYGFVMRNRIPVPRFYILTPIPGTELWKQYRDEGRLLTQDIAEYTTLKTVHRPARIGPDELDAAFWKLYRKTYSFGSILKRTLFHPCFWKRPGTYLFAFFVNMHYLRYIRRGVPPNIF
jgi:radical SAM superfamily enzyme YgiQ (UPF0313 family)